MAIQQYNMINALNAGTNAVIDQRYARNRNSLADLELQNAPTQMAQQNTLGQQSIERNNALLDDRKAALGDKEAQEIVAGAQFVMQSPSPKAFAQQRFPELVSMLQQQGVPWEQLSDDDVRGLAQEVGAQYSAKLGQGPSPVPVPFEQTDDYKKLQLQQQGAVSLEQQRAASAAAIERQRASSASALERQRAESAAALEKIRQAAQGKPSQNENDAATRTWRTYVTARDGLLGALGQTTTGPVLGRAPAFTAKQQTADGAVSAMAPVLKQIFRVAGEGTFTDKDQELLLKMVPTRTDEPEARKAKAQNIDKIIQEKLGLAPTAGATGGWSIEEVK